MTSIKRYKNAIHFKDGVLNFYPEPSIIKINFYMRTATIGLEIHVELKTKSKMFCRCANDSGEGKPNKYICPVCMGHPGALPMINKEAVALVQKLGAALHGEVARKSHFDRKSYFYPDLPKGYQISQYEKPLVGRAVLGGVRIRRIHLEEDTGRLLHDLDGRRSSLVDFNRAGKPLMELVTEPDIKSGEEAIRFARMLRSMLRHLAISDADMEKGQMRIEVNLSIVPPEAPRHSEVPDGLEKEYVADGEGMFVRVSDLGTKVEIKNLNSFRSVGESIEYEIKRQENALSKGEKIVQETRGWNETKRVTETQRIKESAHDYRYFPDPDLPPLEFSSEEIKDIFEKLPELPEQKKERFIRQFGITGEQADELIEDRDISDYFEEAVSELLRMTNEPNFGLLFNYLSTDVRGILSSEKKDIKDFKVSPEHFAHLVHLIQKGEISSRIAKDMLLMMHETGEDPETIIKEKGIKFVDDEGDLLQIVHSIIKDNEKAVLEYRKGKLNALQFLIGKGMALSGGQADPEKLRELFKKHISS